MSVETKPRKPRWTTGEKLVVVAVVVFLLLLLLGPATTSWNSRIPSIEFEFTFVNDAGEPVPGVALQVIDGEGRTIHHRPIADFYPSHIPTSDENGVLRFHCLAHAIGGTCHEYFFVFETGDCDPPRFTCRFEHQGEIVASVPFDELAYPENRDELPRITRTLALPERDDYGRGTFPDESLVEEDYEFIVVKRNIVIPR